MENIHAQLSRIKEADLGQSRKTITILGAGMAGLAAAYELQTLGHKVRILEASDRIGGRVWTHRFKDGTYGELGAMRIPLHHDYTRHYINCLGLKLRRFVSAHENRKCFYYIRGVQTKIEDAKTNLYSRFRLSSDQANDSVPPDMLGRTITDIVNSLTDEEKTSLLSANLATDRLRDLDRTSLGEFLRIHAGDDAAEFIGSSTGLESFFDRAITNFLRDAISEEGNRLDEIEGGMDLFPQRLGQRIEERVLGSIEMNTQITSIQLRDDRRVDIAILRDGKQLQQTCDVVICTLPFTILRKINVTGFSIEKMDAIRSLSYASSTKVLLHCSERFWEKGTDCIYGGASLTDQLIRATYYPSDNANKVSEPQATHKYSTLYSGLMSGEFVGSSEELTNGPGVLLGSYTWGQDARVMGALPREERRDTVVRMISKFHREIANYVDDDASMFWDTYQWTSGGAFSFLQPGEQSTIYKHAIQPEGNVHFAGEHCSLQNAWIQGALSSALRAVEEIVHYSCR